MALFAPKSSPAADGRRRLVVPIGGHDWTVHVQVPSAAAKGAPLPLVLIFHGAGSGGDRVLDQNGWADKAERAGFLAAAPDGLAARPHRPAQFFLNPRLWNDGQLRPNALRVRTDDGSFVRTLIARLQGEFTVDGRRIFAAGHSNGAGLVFRIGAEMADRLAGMAAAAGHCWIESPRPVRPLPTLYIIGTRDPLIPVEGGEVSLPWGKRINPPVRLTLETWASAIGAAGPPRSEDDPPAGLHIETYGRAGERAHLRAVYVQGHGHGWPGGRESLLPERYMGPSVRTFDAMAACWDFFSSLSL